jgi:thioredoxin 1
MSDMNIRVSTDATFDTDVAQGLTLVDFWAPWCGPCRVIGPMLEQLAIQYDARLRILKIDVDQNPRLAAQFRVRSIPMLLLFRDGVPLDSIVGAPPRAQLNRWIEAHLGQNAAA